MNRNYLIQQRVSGKITILSQDRLFNISLIICKTISQYMIYFREYIALKKKTHNIYQFQISLIDFSYHKQSTLCMITFDGRSYDPRHIIIPKKDVIDEVYISSTITNN